MSPILVSVYVDDLFKEIKSLYGMHGILLIHFMYTDDLVVFSLSSAGLQRLFHIRSPYCMTFNRISDTMSLHYIITCL